jgi:RNA polymerase sigma-70 factor (ECF subfamily)
VLVESLPSSARVRQDDLALRRLTHLSDEALVALVARGDESALGELYDRVWRVAYGIAYRVLRDDRLAEDAVQEGFLAAWRSAAAFRADRAKASTWIVTLVHRRAVDIVRREERRRAEPLEAENRPDPVDPTGSAEDTAWLGFERDRVQAALRALPDTQREAIELAYYGGYSQSELAERLGVPLGTIKSRMFAGLARLRELLDEAGAEGSWTPRLTS